MLQVLVDVCTPEVIQTSMLPAVLKLATDPVANVRFNVAKSLTNIAQQMETRCVGVCVCVCVWGGLAPLTCWWPVISNRATTTSRDWLW